MSIKQNITSLQNLLEQVNALPEAGGVELPELSNEGTAADLLSGKELIDGDGNIVTGTFSIDSELSTQDDLIAQIQATVDNLPEADNGSGSISYDTCIVEISTNVNSSVIYSTLDENSKITMTWTPIREANTHSLTVICGSYIFIPVASPIPGYNISGDAEFVEWLGGYSLHRTMVFKINETSTINCYDND